MMGFIPMTSMVTVSGYTNLDEWGEAIFDGSTREYKASIHYTTRNQMISGAKGNEVVATAKIVMQGLVNISYSDTIRFMDRVGNVQTFKPLNIALREDLSGNILFTVLEV